LKLFTGGVSSRLKDPRTRALAVKKRVLRRVIGQFHRPHGLGGHLAGWVMAHRSSNRRRNAWVVSLMDVQPTDRVLEIGFGPGVAARELGRLATKGHVYGVDHSAVMVRQARRRNSPAVRKGRVDLRLGSVEALPDFEGPLDRILAVNSMGFWPDPAARLAELRSRLRSGGVIAIASQPRCPGATHETSAQAGREIEAALRSAGFSRTRVETLDLDPPVVCVTGSR
jgi:SAM-dependent methyltransferase